MRRGFTLVELIVVVGIVALIASLALANFPSFRGRLALDREAGKVALAFRTAQQYSSGVRRFEGATFSEPLPADLVACGGLFEAQFPAYSTTVSLDNNKEYMIFADPDCDRRSESYVNDLIERTALENNLRIEDICINIDSPSPRCGADDIVKLDVWYVRPNPTLVLTVNDVVETDAQSAKIILKAEDGSKKSIIVRKTGQVSIQNEQ